MARTSEDTRQDEDGITNSQQPALPQVTKIVLSS